MIRFPFTKLDGLLSGRGRSGTRVIRLIVPLGLIVLCSCQALQRTETPAAPAAETDKSVAAERRQPVEQKPVVAASAVEKTPSVEKTPAAKRNTAVEKPAVGESARRKVTHVSQPQPQSQPAPAIVDPAPESVPAPFDPPAYTYVPCGPDFGGPGCWQDGEFALRAANEYVCNGGDHQTAVVVKQDWTVHGLHPGDTVVHFDTVDGKTKVAHSNDVCLYAPRFAAVRKVYGPLMSEQHDRPAGVDLPVIAVQGGDVGEPTTVVQPLQPGRRHAIAGAQQFREGNRGLGLDNLQIPATAQDRFLPFEDFLLIRRGEYDNSEKARLAARLHAAVTWTRNQAPQVTIDNKPAQQFVGETDLESVYTYVVPPGKPSLRVCKVASKHNAHPGDLVDFTLRFDNLGDQVIGNVTVLDRLHERLEYVPDSQSCTLRADFVAEEMQDGSPRVLRWEINEPMKVGTGGIIRFQCRVR